MLDKELYYQFRLASYVTALASPLKAAASKLFSDISISKFTLRQFKEEVIPGYNLSPRQILQKLGTGIRDQFGAGIFTKLCDANLQYLAGEVEEGCFILTDIRYQNEAEWLLSKENSVLIAMTRPGDVDATKHNHSSEEGIDFMDLKCPDRIYHVLNTGTLDELRELAASLAAKVVQQ
jgi:hypothetical protein